MTDETEVPSAPILVRHAAQTAVGVLTKRLRRLLYRNEWFVAARPFVSPAPCEQLASLRDHPFIPIDAPRGASFADPFPFEDDGQIYLFVEELRAPDPRGVISCLLLDDSVRPAGPVREVLRRPYHLSYPFVFRHGGDIFMIPESSENSSVELYRATAFPTAWTLEEVLFRGINAVDATLFEDGGRMWLFMTVAEGGFAPTENLHVYHADRLSGPWQPHLRNPVVTDVRSARSAGRLYRRRGELIRPSQDNSRQYGYALVFNRIERLTPEEYHEREIARLDPTWLPRLTATHTYNYTEKVEAIDGRRPMLKPPFDLVRRRARS